MKQPMPQYPVLDEVTNETIEKGLKDFEVTRKVLFNLSTYAAAADMILGSLAYFSSCYATSHAVVSIFNRICTPKNALPYPPSLLTGISLALAPGCLALHLYLNLGERAERYYQAGAHSNILYRRSKDILALPNSNNKREAWRQLCYQRDLWERAYLCATPDWVYHHAKEALKLEHEKKELERANKVLELEHAKKALELERRQRKEEVVDGLPPTASNTPK